MKKLIILTLILLPLAANAQKAKTTVTDFFNKYNEYPNYSSVEVTEDMFKMFGDMEEADSETVAFLKKLKFVRFMEYDPPTVAMAGTRVIKGSNFYVDGQKVSTAVVASESKKHKSHNSTSIVKVSGKEANVVMSQSSENSLVYNRAMKEIIFDGYTKLMKSNQDGEKLLFLRRQYTSNPNDQEFVLLSDNTFIQIRGDINIKHLYELDEIMDAIGEILPN